MACVDGMVIAKVAEETEVNSISRASTSTPSLVSVKEGFNHVP